MAPANCATRSTASQGLYSEHDGLPRCVAAYQAVQGWAGGWVGERGCSKSLRLETRSGPRSSFAIRSRFVVRLPEFLRRAIPVSAPFLLRSTACSHCDEGEFEIPHTRPYFKLLRRPEHSRPRTWDLKPPVRRNLAGQRTPLSSLILQHASFPRALAGEAGRTRRGDSRGRGRGRLH